MRSSDPDRVHSSRASVSRSWPGQLDPLRYEPQRRSAAGDWCGHSAMPASAQPPPAGRSAAGTGQIPRPRLPVALQSVRLAQSLLPGPSAHAIAPASPSVVAGRLHSSREHPHLPPGDHIWQGAHPRGSPSVKSSFRSRISRTPGPIDRVHSFSSSWVTRYPRCCHQGSDFQATPAAFRLVPAVKWLPSVSRGRRCPPCECAPGLAAVKQRALDGGCGPALAGGGGNGAGNGSGGLLGWG